MENKKEMQGVCFCIPTLAGVFGLYFLPFLMALWRSVHQGMGNVFVGLQNYADLFGNAAFRLAAKNTLLFWGVSLPLNLILGILIALLCERLFARGQKATLFFPAMVPAACVVLLAQSVWPVANLGQGAALLLQVGLFLWKSSGYTILILSAALHEIPREMIESAASCGANGWQVFWCIKLPLIAPAVGASALVAFLNSFKIFRENYLLWGTHPDSHLYGIQHFLYNNFANMNYPRLAAASVLLIAAVAGACAVVWRIAKKRGIADD
ncbi:MAG: sugar ABC transporter permease [Pygmaiobacter sp.]|nr:sugar ABC transporter permease [Pygmaiobacter sp.]